MKVNKAWDKLSEQSIQVGDFKYRVTDIVDLAKDLPVMKAPLDTFFMDYYAPCDNCFLDFVSHVKQTIEADLRYPIILSPKGVVIDGRHRLAKAMLKNKKKIKFVRLESMPVGTYVDKESSDKSSTS